jgi:phosphohistidine phosphatase
MLRLMLLRHAKAEFASSGQTDAERTLAARGREVAPVMGHYLAQHSLRPDTALVSTALRTRQTWQLVAAELDQPPPATFEARLYDATAHNLLAVLQELPSDVHSVLVVGHNPGVQELATLLIASGDITARQSLLEKFPTASVAVIDFPVRSWAEIRPNGGRVDRFVTPRMLSLGDD